MLSRTHFFSSLHLAIKNQLQLKPILLMVQPSGLCAFWLCPVKERCRIVSGGSLKRAKGTFPDTHSKACLADHQTGPHQMPPPPPLEGKGYGITLSPVWLATDLEVGPAPKTRGGEGITELEGGKDLLGRRGNPPSKPPATSTACCNSITSTSWGQGSITLLDHDSQGSP